MKSSNKQVLVVGDRILIRPDTGEKKSPAGLYLPPSVIEKQEVKGGMVVEVGPGIPLGSPESSLNEPWKEKKSDIKLEINNSNNLSFDLKKNLETDSTEFYNLAYNYVNDCLKAGLVYRREFYNDSELEAENSLMFKVTLSPFGEISSPKF